MTLTKNAAEKVAIFVYHKMAALGRRSHQRTLQYLRHISSTAVYNDSIDIAAANKEGSVAVQDERSRQVSLFKIQLLTYPIQIRMCCMLETLKL